MSDNGDQSMKTGTNRKHLQALRCPFFIVPGSAISTQQLPNNVLPRAAARHLNQTNCKQWRLSKLEHGFTRVLKNRKILLSGGCVN
jgi:hypothetical protein